MKIVFGFLLVVSSLQVRSQNDAPNIVLILADDLGYADVEGYGDKMKTPHLKQLQENGMSLTSFYAMSQCTPSRAALMTGCYPARVSIPYVVGPKGPAWTEERYNTGLNPEEETLPELLKARGYRTAVIGKWHLGHQQRHLPLKHGFDSFFGLPYSHDMNPVSSSDWPDLPLIQGDSVIEKNPAISGLTGVFTSKACEFITENRSNPFFLYVAHVMPHVPLQVSHNFEGASGQGLYGDVIRELDWSVGEIVKAVKKHDLERKTIIIFTSDNGPWLIYGDHAGSAKPFSHGKATTFEGGTRVPMIISWPGTVRENSRSAIPCSLVDLLPTLVDLTDSPKPTRKIDGHILSDVLLQNGKGVEYPYYFFNESKVEAVRLGKWKLHLPHEFDYVKEAGVSGRRGVSKKKSVPVSLFNLSKDPGEDHNLAASHPELVAELTSLARNFESEIIRNRRRSGE